MNMHPHVEEWDRYWKDKSIKKRMIEFIRRNYFSKIFIFEILKNVQTSGSLLEAGCGSGTYLQMIQSENEDIFCVGIDNSKESVKIAKDKNVEIVLGDIFNLPFKDKTFKVAFNQGVMEHFNDNEFRKILKELARVAENVLILLPASTSIFQLYDPIGDDDDKRFFSKKKLKQLLSLELSDVKVNYLWKTGGLTISGSGKAK